MCSSRIVYSREQLLSLASSPLSQTPPHIPAEISRSPEKSSLLGQAAANRSVVGALGGHAVPGDIFGAGNGSIKANGDNSGLHGGVRTTNGSSVPRSPPAHSSRSPGNAFNFASGPVSPNGMSHSTSFKERLAAAQGQQQQQQQPRHQGSLAQQTDNGAPARNAAERVNGAHGDEQFDMEI